MPNELQIALTFLLLGCVFGIVIGQTLATQYGKTARDCKNYHDALLRIIPKLQNHYTSDYIYWELIKGGEISHEDEDNDER